MPVPLLDLQAQYATIQSELEAAVLDVLRSQHFILGPKVEECERAVAAYCQCAHGVGVSSGTDALLACLMAEGIGPGDEVITTSYTFFATAGSIARLGATPVFVDIDPDTYNIDPSLIEPRITPRTKAVIPVHLFGQCADMDPILDIAQRHNLVVIEDAAQAIGAEYRGRRGGSMGHYGCLSFFPSKNLGCAGDGGMIVTQDSARAERLRILRAHGSKPKYHHQLVGGNFRLDAIQAAVVLVKLRHLDAWTAARQSNASRYRRLLRGETSPLAAPPLPMGEGRGEGSPILNSDSYILNSLIQLPYERGLSSNGSLTPDTCHLTPVSRHIYNQFVIRTPHRDSLQAYLRERGIGTEVYYPIPMHLQACFAEQRYQVSGADGQRYQVSGIRCQSADGQWAEVSVARCQSESLPLTPDTCHLTPSAPGLPLTPDTCHLTPSAPSLPLTPDTCHLTPMHAERAALETLALPIYPELTDAQAREVVQAITEWSAQVSGDSKKLQTRCQVPGVRCQSGSEPRAKSHEP